MERDVLCHRQHALDPRRVGERTDAVAGRPARGLGRHSARRALLLSRVLIADDDPLLLELLHDFLASQGYEVVAVATGTQVLEAVPTFQPDVIVVDMVLPGLSGIEILTALRQAACAVPVILISGHQIIMREGFFGVLRKPFHFRRLAEVVAAAVNHGPTGA